MLEHTPAILHGFKLAFNYLGTRLVEPAFGNLKVNTQLVIEMPRPNNPLLSRLATGRRCTASPSA